MYIFYQMSSGDESWRSIEDTKDNREMLTSKGVFMVSILAISDPNTDDYDKVKYKGDLYFDIDAADITDAIEALNKLVKRLQDMDVRDIEVYCSGKKGFHVIVPAKVFSKGVQVAYLPYIYGNMAEKLKVSGLDFAVYSGRKGRLWRQENVLRKDVSSFKSYIDLKEVKTLTPEKYKVYVSSPRPTPEQTREVTKSLELTELYEACKIQTIEEEKKKSKFIFEPLEELKGLTEVPECIHNLVTKGDEKNGSNFNKAAMQLAGYIKSAGHPKEVIDDLVKTMANNVKSGTYNTVKKRISHIWSQVRRAANDTRMGFAPSYLFSTIDPCGNCILCDGTLDKHFKEDKKSEGDGEVVDNNPIFESDNYYYMRAGKVDYPVTTFTIEPIAFSEIFDTVTGIPERESTTVKVTYAHLGAIKSRQLSIPEKAWDTPSAFKSAISGVDNITFMGGDAALANLKHYVFSRDSEMGRVTKTKSCGIDIYRDPTTRKSLLVYTEPQNSINSFGEPDTHEVYKDVPTPPRVLNLPNIDSDNPVFVDEANPNREAVSYEELAKKLCGINSKVNMAQILGWYVACHFKPHIMACEKQFPLLGLWGNAGSGKSKTASVMTYLHGCDFEGVDSVVSCGGSTAWSLAQYIASSTSTPRLFDEFNKPKLKAKYGPIVDMFKGCFNNQSMTKGVLGNKDGAEVAQTKLTGPVVMMSEQFPDDEPPLIQRTVTVKLSRKSHEGCEDNWKFVYDNRAMMSHFAKALVLSALKTPKSVVKHWMDYYYDLIPPEREIDARPHFSFRVVLTGLKLYELTLKSCGIDVSAEIEDLTSSLIDHLHKSQEFISKTKNRSVVDDVLDVMAQMATETEKDQLARNGMRSASAYLRTTDTIWIDAESVYGRYKAYMRSTGEQIVISTYRGFHDLLRDEPYYVCDEECELLTTSRKCVRLDVEKMRAKGVSVDLFVLGDE